jgi:urease gamma subunit
MAVRFFLLIAVYGLASLRGGNANTLPVIPTPQEWSVSSQTVRFSDLTTVWVSSEAQSLGQQFSAELREYLGKELSVELLSGTLPAQGIILALLPAARSTGEYLHVKGLLFAPQMAEEGYVLSAESGRVVLAGQTLKGLFYATRTLKQLLIWYSKSGEMPACTVRDWPDFKIRGISDDISRGQVSKMEDFKRIIRFLADHKMNTYMPYLEDLFFFKKYPSIGKGRGTLTPEQWRDLQDYAEKYFVEIIPIFQTLGHYENILNQAEFLHLAEFPGSASLNIGSEKTYGFLQDLLGEIAPVFRSSYFHMGADESWDVGAWATRRMAERIGIASLHARHYRRVYEMLRKYGKRVLMYGDIVLQNPTILNEIPNDIIMVDWHYGVQDHYPSVEVFARAGQPYLVSPGVHDWRKVFPNLTAAVANIRQLLRDGKKFGALGAITSSWGDYGGPNFRQLNGYGFAYAAECSWNVEAGDLFEFEQKFFPLYYGSPAPDLANAYHLLNEMTREMEWMSFFYHPFYPLWEPARRVLHRALKLQLYSAQVLRLLDAGRLRATRRTDFLDLLRFTAKVFQWYGHVLDVKVQMWQTDRWELDEKVRRALLPKYRDALLELAGQVRQLRDEYRSLWLRYNQEANLHRLLALYDRLAAYLEIKAEEVAQGDLSFNGQLPAAFIGFAVDEEGKGPSHIFLRKTFVLEEKPRNAWLQIIADSHARVWVNGKYVDEVYARRTLSAWVESQRVRARQVTDLLRRGKNVIAVEVRQYVPGRAALANVVVEATMKNGRKLTILSDPYWKAADRPMPGWNRWDFYDADWPNAVTGEIKWKISRPYFDRGLPSRIEFR